MENARLLLQAAGYFAAGIGLLLAILAVYVISVIVAWKKYDYFNTSLLSSVSMTGFQYHCKKIGMCFIIVPGAVLAIVGTIVQKVVPDNLFATNTTAVETVKDAKVENPSQSTNSEVTATVAATTEKTTQPEASSQQKTYTKEEVEQMEEKAQYHGDDQTVRDRLGLPPKPAN